MKWSWVISEVRIDRQKTSRCMLWSLSDTVDGSEIRRSPVEVGRKLPWFTGGLIDLTWCRGSANSILPLDSCRFIRKLIKQKIRFVQINCWIIINRLITTVFFSFFFLGGGGGGIDLIHHFFAIATLGGLKDVLSLPGSFGKWSKLTNYDIFPMGGSTSK